MTFDQQEPSANSPCTKTTFFVFSDVCALATSLSRGKAATAAAAPINVRRFIRSLRLNHRYFAMLRNGKPAQRNATAQIAPVFSRGPFKLGKPAATNGEME
jgi:hypothetical protein